MPARFAWLVLVFTVGVISWGAYVRATGSGAGCGAHWPLCNGQVLPRTQEAATLVEFSHRATSGLALLAVVALLVWTFRARPRGHLARTAAGFSLFLILTEAAIGAGLVLFELVADNATMARAMFMAAHLLNTFLLLAALALTAWWLTVEPQLTRRGKGKTLAGLVAGCVLLLLAGASGAVAALGDTLFRSATLAEGLRADLSPGSHLLIRLRVLHPVLALAAAMAVLFISRRLRQQAGRAGKRAARSVGALAVLQVGLGVLNVLLLAPVWLQLLHLLVADAIWIGFVLLGADALEDRTAAAAVRAA